MANIDYQEAKQEIVKMFRKKGDSGLKVIFWYDPPQVFKEDILSDALYCCRVLVCNRNEFAIKKTIEHDEPDADFLVYIPSEKPDDISIDAKDYLMHIQDCQGVGLDSNISLAAMTAYCSCALDLPVQPQMCILGSMSIGGTINKVEELASTLQVAFDAGAKRILIPMCSAADIATVPTDLFAKFQISSMEARRML